MATPKTTKSTSAPKTLNSSRIGVNAENRVAPQLELKRRIQEPLLNPELQIIERSMNDLWLLLQTSISATILDGNSVANSVTLKQAIEGYAVQIDRIVRTQSDWKSLVARVVAFESDKIGIDVLNQLDAKVQAELALWREEIMNADGMAIPVPSSVVTAKLASADLDSIKAALSSSINEAIDQFHASIRSQLIRLVELEAISFVEWFSANTCSYKRFSRRVVSELLKSQLIRPNVIAMEGGFWKKGTIHSLNGSTKRTLSCRIQHLTNAKSYPLGESEILVPREQSAFIRSIPQWLCPAVNIVEGTLIRETLVEQDLSVAEWEVTLDQTQWHYDPAIVLGPFVLSVWGPKEIQAEFALQQAEAQEQAKVEGQEKRKMAPIRILGLVEVMLATFFCMGWRISIVNLVIGLISALLAFVTLGNRWKFELQDKGLENVDDDSTPDDAFGYAGMLIFSVVFSSFLLSVGLIVGGVGCALIALLFLRLYINATFRWNPVDKTETRDD